MADAAGALVAPLGVAVEVFAPKLQAHDVLESLSLPSPDVAENSQQWDEELAADWTQEDEYVEGFELGTRLMPRWVRINGLRVYMVEFERQGVPVTEPVLVDAFEDEIVPKTELIVHGWFSEGGGAPISWAGGNSLGLLSDQMLLLRQWGDHGREAEIAPVPPTEGELADFIAGWVESVQADVAWAFATVPLDPDGTLSAEERELWEERIEEPDLTLWMELPAALEASVSHSLMATSRFRRIAEGLTHPSGPEGRRLAKALDDVNRSGVLGAILQY